jgi:hypothetical protein
VLDWLKSCQEIIKINQKGVTGKGFLCFGYIGNYDPGEGDRLILFSIPADETIEKQE